ncbi:MAG: DUF1638 domain-containing protein [Acidimicrobiales bacterium]|nr:DUF1638 domain-containing protein [Hyphomonadaceae bacterium]RZV34668.1 MAG: DUF1638 domain-containing protein [Acidimicrobiales bacterium]
MEEASHKTLIVACGALAKEILAVKENLKMEDGVFDLQCLPAGYHNFPDKIVPGLKEIIDARGDDYDRILIGYGDCGTGGGLDRMMEKYPKTERLPGAHCYAFYSGLSVFDDMMEDELGSFFLTDYLVRHFETLIIKGFGIDRYPNLKDDYFKHYKRLIYISQAPSAELIARAKKAADFLGLEFENRNVGYGELATHISTLQTGGRPHV